jgi:FkbM family methyltransferase
VRKLAGWIIGKTGSVFNRVSKGFYSLSRSVYTPPVSLTDQNKKIWYKIDGDKSLRVQYPLNESAIVIDVGGYEGDWAAEISARYACTLHIFEPVAKFVKLLQTRFNANPKITIHNFGLSDKDEQLEFSVMDESSSAFTSTTSYNTSAQQMEKVQLKKFSETMLQLGINRIDLIKINIEGGEYPLLEHMIVSGWINKVENIQVQFHDFVPDAEKKMKGIKEKLAKTHQLTYEYIYVWENWKRKDAGK